MLSVTAAWDNTAVPTATFESWIKLTDALFLVEIFIHIHELKALLGM